MPQQLQKKKKKPRRQWSLLHTVGKSSHIITQTTHQCSTSHWAGVGAVTSQPSNDTGKRWIAIFFLGVNLQCKTTALQLLPLFRQSGYFSRPIQVEPSLSLCYTRQLFLQLLSQLCCDTSCRKNPYPVTAIPRNSFVAAIIATSRNQFYFGQHV